MHEKVFSIQIFQYFRQIVRRVCTLVLFINQWFLKWPVVHAYTDYLLIAQFHKVQLLSIDLFLLVYFLALILLNLYLFIRANQ